MMGAVAIALAASLTAAPLPGLGATEPYKIDSPWSFYVNGGTCSAGMMQASNASILSIAFDARENAFTVGFTERKTGAVAEVSRQMGIRLTRAGGVLDDGWEDIAFVGFDWTADQMLWVSQPMPDPAMHDFSDFESLVFIDHGRTVGAFRGRNNQAAVRELRRCAKEQKAKL